MNSRFVCLLLFLFVFCIVFLPFFLFAGIFPAYRDGEYFYYPLFQFIQMKWQDGIYPLWNPCEAFGFPLAANATSALFYPPTWLLLLPIPVWLVFNIYILGHVMLAGVTMGFVIRRWRGSWQACCLGAVSYAFSGTLLSLYANQIYLVSAAWLPLGIWSIYESLCGLTPRKRFRCGLICAISIALMTLGGDPQTGYHLGMIGGLLWLFKVISWLRSGDGWSQCGWNALLGLKTLILTGLFAGILSAVVIIPQYKLIRESDRMVSAITPADKILKEEKKYVFSLPPWRVNELVFGTMNGRSYPVFTRWVDMLPLRENGIWVQSLYMGTFPFLLAFCSLCFFRSSIKRRWLSWIFVLSLCAAFGSFALGAGIKYAAGFCGWKGLEAIPSQWGGVYWAIDHIFPGYNSFRYPGKWLPVTAAVLALLAGLAWDPFWQSVRRGGKPVKIMAGLMFFFGFISFVAPLPIIKYIRFCMSDESFRKSFTFETFGPFVGYNPFWLFLPGLLLTGMGVVLTVYLRHAGCLTGALFNLSGDSEEWDEESEEESGESADKASDEASDEASDGTADKVADEASDRTLDEASDRTLDEALNECADKVPEEKSSLKSMTPVSEPTSDMASGASRRLAWVPALFLLIIALDLALTNRGLILIARDQDCTPYLTHSGPPKRYLAQEHWMPIEFKTTSSLNRASQTVSWNSSILLFNHAFPNNVSGIGYNGTLRLLDYSISDEVSLRHNVFIEPALTEYHIDKPFSPKDLKSHIPNPKVIPRACIVRDVEWIKPQPGETKGALYNRAMEKMFVDGKPKSFRKSAVAVGDKPAVAFDTQTAFQDKADIVDYSCHRVVMDVDAKAPGLLVFFDQFWDEWELQIERIGTPGTHKGEIIRTNNMFRGTIIDKPGQYRLTYQFKPTSIYRGLAVSVVAWLAVIVLLGFCLRRDKKQRNSAPGFIHSTLIFPFSIVCQAIIGLIDGCSMNNPTFTPWQDRTVTSKN